MSEVDELREQLAAAKSENDLLQALLTQRSLLSRSYFNRLMAVAQERDELKFRLYRPEGGAPNAAIH